MPVAPWLDNTPEDPVEELTTDQLLDLWNKQRNSLGGVMAAEEVMKRLIAQREENKP